MLMDQQGIVFFSIILSIGPKKQPTQPNDYLKTHENNVWDCVISLKDVDKKIIKKR